jgi:dipeptide/tripeptide permease
MATLGLQRNLVIYFTTKINMSNSQAANMVSNFVGTLYLTPFLGGFVADAYLGRFWAIAVFATIQVVVSHIIHESKKRFCCSFGAKVSKQRWLHQKSLMDTSN